MNENPRDIRLASSETHAAVIQDDFESQRGSDPLSPDSNCLREDYEETVNQEVEGVQKRELLSSSSGETTFSSNSISGKEAGLKEADNKKPQELLKLDIKRFLAIYCEITPIACLLRERIALLLSILICSKVALETNMIKELIPQVLLVAYCCLSYQMIESVLLYWKAANSRAQKVEFLFDIVNKALLAFVIFVLDLQDPEQYSSWFLFLLPLVFLLELQMYQKQCSIAQSRGNDEKVVWRIFCLFQTAMIVAKMTNIIDIQWKRALLFMLSYAGIYALYAPLAFMLLVAVSVAAFRLHDTRTLHLLKSRVFGYIWKICFNLLYAVGVVLIFGFSAKVDLKNGDTFELGLKIAKILSFCLVISLVLLFPILKKSEFNLFEDLCMAFQDQVARVVLRKKYNLVKTGHKNKSAFFLMVSPTYFSQLGDVSQYEFEEMMKQNNDIEAPKNKEEEEEEEESLCYICEENVSDAILAECGHGGVCCKCAVKLIGKKNECMGCRKPAKAIYKIENSSNLVGKRIQAHEIIEIIEI